VQILEYLEAFRANSTNSVILLGSPTARMARGMHNCNLEMILHDSNSFRKGLEMEPTYDIFKRRDQGYPFWITAVETLEEARERTTSFALVAPGEYFIYSQGEGIILECVTPRKEERRASRPIWFMPQSWNSKQHRTAA
jgi:hypothetical protein